MALELTSEAFEAGGMISQQYTCDGAGISLPLAAGVSTPLGALVSYSFVAGIGERALGILLALSAGALVYVWAGHLIPTVEEQDRRYSTVALLGGLLLGMGIILSGENPF